MGSGVLCPPDTGLQRSRMKRPPGIARGPLTSPSRIMPRPETHAARRRVPVSKAEKPVAARDLRRSNPDTTRGGSPDWEFLGVWFGDDPDAGTLRERAERHLFRLEAMAELMAAELGEQTPRGRLLACRWAAARSLLLEVLEGYESRTPETRPVGFRWAEHEHAGLLGALVRRHGWKVASPGVLVRPAGADRG